MRHFILTLILAVFGMVGMGLGVVHAQDGAFYVPLPMGEDAEEQRSDQELDDPEVRQPTDGILTRLFRPRGASKLLNPRAPKELGHGQNTVSTDPNDPDKKPKGFILFSFNW